MIYDNLWYDLTGIDGTSMNLMGIFLILLGSIILILAGNITSDLAIAPRYCWNDDRFLSRKKVLIKRSAGLTGSGIFYVAAGLVFQLLSLIQSI